MSPRWRFVAVAAADVAADADVVPVQARAANLSRVKSLAPKLRITVTRRPTSRRSPQRRRSRRRRRKFLTRPSLRIQGTRKIKRARAAQDVSAANGAIAVASVVITGATPGDAMDATDKAGATEG